MAWTGVSGIAAVLVNDRTDRRIRNVLQTDTAFWDKLKVKGRTWSGDAWIIGLRSGRNQSARSVVGNKEPKPGQQGLIRLTVGSKTNLLRIQFDLLMLLAAENDAGSQAVEPMDEIDNGINDIAKQMTYFAFLGGGGLQALNNANADASPIGVGWQSVNPAAGANGFFNYGYTGRFTDIATNMGPAQLVRFIRLDTYAQVGIDTQLGTISEASIGLTAAIDTTGVPLGVGIGVFLTGPNSQAFQDVTISGDNIDSACVTDPAGKEVGQFAGDMTGIVANLVQKIHFGNDRSSADVLIKKTRSNFAVVNNTNAAGGDVFSTSELSKLYNRIRGKSGKRPDETWCNWDTVTVVEQSLVGVSSAAVPNNVRVSPDQKHKDMSVTPDVPEEDQNYTGYSPGGIKIAASDMCPNGTFLTLRYDGIERLFRGKEQGMWLTQTGFDGNPLYKLQGETLWGATRAIVAEQCVSEPNRQGMLIGVAKPQ